MSKENLAVDNKQKPITHSTYEITGCIFTNADEMTTDIRPILSYIKIYENIFSPALTVELGIRDDFNFLEEFNVRGNETILLEFNIMSIEGVVRSISLELYVKEYRDYYRVGEDQTAQSYIIVAVPFHAYIAPLIKISRSEKSAYTSTQYIRKILVSDLGVATGDIYESIDEATQRPICATSFMPSPLGVSTVVDKST